MKLSLNSVNFGPLISSIGNLPAHITSRWSFDNPLHTSSPLSNLRLSFEMDRLSRSARRCPRFTLQSTNRALQSRSYTKETLSKLNKRKPGRTTVATGKKLNRSRVGKVEAFGKPREQNSNAAKILRMQESRKVEKALTHEHHGENVYAYAHIRTGQVVYSLTRVMDVRYQFNTALKDIYSNRNFLL